eukprot:gene1207-biopygen9298
MGRHHPRPRGSAPVQPHRPPTTHPECGPARAAAGQVSYQLSASAPCAPLDSTVRVRYYRPPAQDILPLQDDVRPRRSSAEAIEPRSTFTVLDGGVGIVRRIREVRYVHLVQQAPAGTPPL